MYALIALMTMYKCCRCTCLCILMNSIGLPFAHGGSKISPSSSPLCLVPGECRYMYIHVLMRDEKEGRKKQARLNKQTRQSNTMYTIHVPSYTLWWQLATDRD